MFCIVKICSTTGNFVHKKRHMQTSKFKVLLYLKKSKLYKSKQAPIMKWVTYEQTIAQFSYKFSCDPKLWNAQENKLNSENRKAMATNGKLKRFLLSVQSAYRELCERSVVFMASDIKEQFHLRHLTELSGHLSCRQTEPRHSRWVPLMICSFPIVKFVIKLLHDIIENVESNNPHTNNKEKLHHIPIIPSEVCLCTSTGTLPSGTRYWDSFLIGRQE